MKEIDFLPEWYKSKRIKRVSYCTQYVTLGLILLIMLMLNFVLHRSTSMVKADLIEMSSERTNAENVSLEFSRARNQQIDLRKKIERYNKLDSRINVPNVLGELSFMIDKKIVLSKVEFNEESFNAQQTRNKKTDEEQILGDIRFKIAISGYAADSSDVAKLVCKLEDSSYFCNVYPTFSRNTDLGGKVIFSGNIDQLSEFEIVCYLANYRQKKNSF